ncbi:MAG: DsbA family oxidoreductase, partial [Chitinophagaceae bacterium]|nr:DsbA family oxidoreductase [Rubrivivax sp.]
RLEGDIDVQLEFQPFELNPDMPPEGENADAYLARKYGRPPEERQAMAANLRQRGAEVGFVFGVREQVWNTFDAHRLLMWAGEEDPAAQRALKHALLRAYHSQGLNPGEPELLVSLAGRCGLDPDRAAAVVGSDEYAQKVRERESRWPALGIHSVPSVVIDGRHLIEGGQPAAVFERALREIAARAA